MKICHRPPGARRISRNLILTLLVLIAALTAKAQQNPDSIAITGNTSWQLIRTTPELRIYAIETDCNDSTNGFFTREVWLKFENQTANTLTLSWKKKLYYDNKCHGCGSTGSEQQSLLTLAPNQTQTGSCGSSLSIFLKMTQQPGQALTSFELSNLTIH